MEARKTVPHPHLDNKAKASVRRVLDNFSKETQNPVEAINIALCMDNIKLYCSDQCCGSGSSQILNFQQEPDPDTEKENIIPYPLPALPRSHHRSISCANMLTMKAYLQLHLDSNSGLAVRLGPVLLLRQGWVHSRLQ